ncbi:flagellar basal body L-ring protein FlgH [Phycisphaerales bacterium AB-hyl4]|uniref:Flagellar basal body L-ring protein FlgH n=1 Tax=Natronomicrosphaera hydrolytica TaxID=3242702 RepID=A0ABV4U643_9BACT
MQRIMPTTLAILLTLAVALPAIGQSSSLFAQPSDRHRDPSPQAQGEQYSVQNGTLRERRQATRLSPAIANASYSAVRIPEPRSFAMHDLITIIIRESTDTSFNQSLDTEKRSNYGGEITDFPRLSVRDLLNFQLAPSSMEQGNPRLGIGFNSNFEGEGDYRRRDSITGRITARVVDVKPNGTLVLEARKYIESDGEVLDMVLTGTARVDDVTTDNTVLSSQLHDLRLSKQHEGELRRTSRKGIFTRILDTIFNF